MTHHVPLRRRGTPLAASIALLLCVLAGGARAQSTLQFQDRAATDFNAAGTVHGNTAFLGALQVRPWSVAERAAFPDLTGNTLRMSLDEAWATPGDVLRCAPAVPGLTPELEGSGGSDVRSVPGVLGNALDLRAGRDDHVRLVSGNVDLASNASAVTLMGWIRPDSWPGGGNHADIINIGGTEETRLAMSLQGANVLRARGEAPDSASSAPFADITLSPSPGSWRMVTTVFELSPSNRVSFYLDGRLLGVRALPFSAAATSAALSDAAALGSDSDYDADYFDGAIDEPSIWKRAMTAEEVRRIYLRQAGPHGGGEPATFVSRVFDSGGPRVRWEALGWRPRFPAWKGLPDLQGTETGYTEGNFSMAGNVLLLHADGTGALADGAVVPDRSSRGHDAVMVAPDGQPASYVPGRIGEGLQLPRAGYLRVGGDASPDFAFGTGDFTWAAWAKVASCDGNNQVVMGMEGTQGQPHVWFGGGCETRCPDSRAWFVLRDSTGTSTLVCTDTRLDDGEWHHLVAVKSGHGPATATLYVDGVPLSATHTSLGDFTFDQGPLLGQFPGLNYPTEATVDEVAIWRRALSAQEVRDLWRRGGTRLKFQARTCDEPSCAGVPFVGPDGTAASFFSERTHGSDDRPPALGSLGLAGATPGRYFQYAVSLETDSSRDTPALTEVTVTAFNSVPAAMPDTYDSEGNGTLQVAAPGLLGNDLDPEGSPLRVVLTLSPENGTLQLGEDGAFEYTPNAGFSGTDRFRYRVVEADSALESEEVEVVLTVSGAQQQLPPGAPVIESPTVGQVLHTRIPVLEGTAEPQTRVELEVNGVELGRTRSDKDGRWSYTVTPDQALPVGNHRVVAYAVGPAQTRSEPSPSVSFGIQPYALDVTGCGSTGGGPTAPWLLLLALGLVPLRAKWAGRAD